MDRKSVRIADQRPFDSVRIIREGPERVKISQGASSGGSASIHSPASSHSFSTDSWSDLGEDEIEPSDSASRSRHRGSRRYTTEVRPAPARRHSSRRLPVLKRDEEEEEEEESPPPRARRRATHSTSKHRRTESRRTPSDESASVASYPEDYPYSHHGAPQPPRGPYTSGYRHVPAGQHGGYPPEINTAQYADPYAAQRALVQTNQFGGYQPNPFSPQGGEPNPFSPMSSAGGSSYFPEHQQQHPQHSHRPPGPQRPQSFSQSQYGTEVALSPWQQYPGHHGMAMPPGMPPGMSGMPGMPGMPPGMPPYPYGMQWPYPAQQPVSHTSSPAPPAETKPDPKLAEELEKMEKMQAKFDAENEKLKKDLQSKDEAEKAKAAEDMARLQAMVKKFEEAQAAAEAAAIAKKFQEEAEKKRKEEIAAAEKKAKENAEKKAEAEAKKAKEEHEKNMAEAKKVQEDLEKKHKELQEEAEKKQKELQEEVKKFAPAPDADKLPIKFKDAVHRTFSFPWHLCKTWKGMETLIRQAFLHIEGLGEEVMHGHYDLQGPDGEIILPQVWETVVKPDWTISMHMWPMPEPKPSRSPKEDPVAVFDPLAGFMHEMNLGGHMEKKPKKPKDGKKPKQRPVSQVIDVSTMGQMGGSGGPPPPPAPPGFPPGMGFPDPLAGFPGMDPLVMGPKDKRPMRRNTESSKKISPLTAWMIGGAPRSKKR